MKPGQTILPGRDAHQASTEKAPAGNGSVSRAANFPFSPARFPVFYGWVIAVVGTLGVLLSIPGQTMGVSVFTDPLLSVLAIERIGLSQAYMFGTILSSFLLPLAGRLYDRLGARIMAVMSSLGLGLTLIYLSQCDTIAQTIGRLLSESNIARVTVELGVLTLGFFLVRFWGQGVLTMVSRAMISKWFQRRRGLVMGLSGMAISLGFSASPSWLLYVVSFFDWRGAWLFLALCVGVGMTAIAWLFYRDAPEECGLLMDGRRADTGHSEDPDEPEEINFTVAQAIRTYPFWVFNLTLALPTLCGTAITFHIQDIGNKESMEFAETIGIFPRMAFFSILTSLVGGWLSDRVRIKYLLGVVAVTQALGNLGLLAFGTELGRWLVVVGIGISSGLFGLLVGVIWPRFYGRAHLGAISSISMSVLVFASAVGPWTFALAEERSGTYTPAAIACIGLAFVCLLASMGIANPQRAADS